MEKRLSGKVALITGANFLVDGGRAVGPKGAEWDAVRKSNLNYRHPQ